MRTILGYNRSHWQILAFQSSVISHDCLHYSRQLAKALEIAFSEGPKFQKFSGGTKPPDPPTLYPYPDFKDLSVFGSRVSRRFTDKWMEGWQGRNRRRGYVFC